jgi:4'-phosphopantetheinyl transferase
VSLDDLSAAGNPDHDFGDPVSLPVVVPAVSLWWCSLARSDADYTRLADTLSAAEHDRAARFGTDELRRRWTTGRGTLRALLGRELGIAPEAVTLRRGRRGRPELGDSSGRVDFNVSHTRGIALVAIARGLPEATRIGVDVEHEDRDVGADRLATKFLTPREQATIKPLDAQGRRYRFLRHWTCKEAMSKATGDGLAAPFRQLDVDLGARPRLVAGPPPYDPVDWTLHVVDAPAGFLATMAIWRDPG